MKLNLQRPLVIFDLETTGLDMTKDRIIQISYIKVYPDGTEERKNYFVNPERIIPQVVVELTHITQEMVQAAPTFAQLAPTLAEDFKDCDFAGFNSNRFDVPFLAEEFARVRVPYDFSQCRLVDVQNIYHKLERRNLAAAYKFYCGRKMEDDFQAHLANEDTEATYRVLQGELDMYTAEKQEDAERILQNDISFLADFSKMNDNVDFAGRMVWGPVLGPDNKPLLDENGKERRQEYINFGKYKGWTVENVLRQDPGYYSWIMSSDFSQDTKQCLTRIRMRVLNK